MEIERAFFLNTYKQNYHNYYYVKAMAWQTHSYDYFKTTIYTFLFPNWPAAGKASRLFTFYIYAIYTKLIYFF